MFTTCQPINNSSYFAGLVAELRCSSIPNPTSGWKSTNLSFIDTTVRFGCYPGYKLTDLKSVTCQINRKWSRTAPSCRGMFELPQTTSFGVWSVSQKYRVSWRWNDKLYVPFSAFYAQNAALPTKLIFLCSECTPIYTTENFNRVTSSLAWSRCPC